MRAGGEGAGLAACTPRRCGPQRTADLAVLAVRGWPGPHGAEAVRTRAGTAAVRHAQSARYLGSGRKTNGLSTYCLQAPFRVVSCGAFFNPETPGR